MKLSARLKIEGFKSAKEFCDLLNKGYGTVLYQYRNSPDLFNADVEKAKEKSEQNGKA